MLVLGSGAVTAACRDTAAVDEGSVAPTASPAGSTGGSTSSLGAPTDLYAVPSDGQVMVAWRPPASEGGESITDYVVQVRTTGAPGAWTTFSDPVTTTSATLVDGLAVGASQDFRVAAVSASGAGTWSDVVTATPGVRPAASFDFDDSDGPFPALPNFDPASYQSLRVVDDRLQTLDDDRMYGGIVPHGVDVSKDWQVDFDVHAPLGIGDGGATVELVDATFSGWAVFAGNATHIQKYASGEHSNDTNDGRASEEQHITLTRRSSDGLMRVYADGVLQGSTVDATHLAGPYLAVFIQSVRSPGFEVWIDNLVVKGASDD